MGIMNLFMSRKNASKPQANAGATMNRRASEATITGLHAKAIDIETYHASDDKAWLNYLGQALRTYRKPGLSLKEEHDLWLAARTQSKAMGAAASARLN